MSCERLHDFADGKLSPGEHKTFRTHLASCPRCPSALDEIRQLKHLLAESERSEWSEPSAPASIALCLPPARPATRRMTKVLIVLAACALLAAAFYWR